MLRKKLRTTCFWSKYRTNHSVLRFIPKATSGLLVFALSSLFVLPVSATDYSASITTSGDVELVSPSGQTIIDHSDVGIITNCKAGYNLTLGTSVNDNNLYLDGDSSNNSTNTYVSPANGTSALKDSPNTWGYFASFGTTPVTPTENSIFSPVPTLVNDPAVLRTPAETASATDINDSFSIYYGANIGSGMRAGTYTMIPEDSAASTSQPGRLAYYLTTDMSCLSDLAITFNKNIDGEGGEEDPGATISNFPTSSDNTIDLINKTVTLSNKRPARTGYQFKEWNTESDGTGNYYHVGDTIHVGEDGASGELTGFVTLYAIWKENCASATVCYDGNHQDAGSMDNQTITAGTTANLIASNFSRSGYGFTGWNTEADGTGTQYGPNQNLTMPSTGGVNLYAQWLAPSGTFQTWSATGHANNMNVGDVIALKDERDNEVYMVAKLADGNIWTTENLRLLPNTATINNRNTNHPTTGFVNAAPSSSSTTSQCSTDNATCDNQIYFNAHNLDRTLTPAYNGATNSTYWYSYGVMYNWYTATAGNGTYELVNSNAAGDLCPAGWHMPTGGSSGEWGVLANNMTGSNGTAKSATLRSYPNNFLYSGDYNPSKNIPDGVGKQGRLWSTTPVSSNIKNAYRMGYNASEVTAATSNSWNKWDNFAIRCIYQGGNAIFADATVTFPDDTVTSIDFYNADYGTVTATPQSPIVSLAENTEYTITATLAPGYELSSWTAGEGAAFGDATENPTTLTITGATTLSLTSEVQTLTCTKQYRLQNADGTYPSTYTSDGTETLDYNTTCTYTKSETNYQTQQDTATMTEDQTISLDLPRNTYELTINKNDTYISSVTGAGTYRWGEEVSISATPATGGSFATWSQTSGTTSTFADSTSATTTFTMPLSDATIYADGEPRTFICTKQYRLQNADGTYPSTYTSDGTETLDYNTTCTYTKSETNYQTQQDTATMTEDQTISLDLPRNTYELTINKNDTYISSVTGAGTYRWGEEVSISATPATGGSFATWSQTSGTTSTFADSTSATTTFTMPLSDATIYADGADNRVLINYDGNGLYYDNDPTNTVNQVYYGNTQSATTETITRYSHTANINDSGVASGTYANNLQTKDVVTIPGATSLNVTIYYSTEANWDYVYVFQGTYTGSVSKNMSAGQLKTYNGGAKTTFAQATQASFTVSGDTATFAFYSDTSSAYYGYYAIVTAEAPVETEVLTPISGTYAVPSSSNPHVFLGWSEDQNATTPTYTNEQDLMNNATYTHGDSPVTLYAVYETYHTITVNLDSGISSVGFYHPNYGTQQVTTNGGTVTLRGNTEYTITASTNPNYFFKSWATTTSGTLGSSTNNPTTFIVAGDSTLTVITEPPYVIAYNPNGGTGSMENQTVPEDAEVNLLERSFIAPSTTSFINANNDTITGEEGKLWLFWGWNTEIDGTGDWYKDKEAVTNLATSGDTITLYAQWRQATIEDLTTGTPIGNEKTIDHNLMQDMSPEACYNSNITSSDNAPATTLLDYRGKVTNGNNPESPEQYTVSKLADGNCWMTKNLNLGRSDGAGPNNDGTITLTPDDTDIASNFTLPASTTTSSTATTTARIRTTNNSGNTNNGVYYSWPAAVASTTSTSGNPTTSICPKNWDLPTNAQYTNLNTKASYSSSNPPTNNPSAFVLGGGFTNGASFYQTTNSYYWTNTSYNSSQAYGRIVSSSSISSSYSTGTTYGGNKYYEKNIRCVASRGKVTIVYDGNGTTEYPVTGTTATQENVELNTNPVAASNGFTRNGWYFNGWNTAPDGSGANVSAGSSIESGLGNLIPGSTTTLYAKWLPQYTITYVNNCKAYASSDANCTTAGSATTSTQAINLNASGSGSGTLGAYNKFTLTGWKIDQWTTNADGTGDSYPVSTNYSISNTNIPSGITLYAHWIPTYTVQYDGNGADNASTGMGSLDTSTGHKSVRHDNLVENDTFDLFASNYKRNGYGFVGWSLDRDAWTKLTDDDVVNDVRIWGPNETFTTPSSDNQIITLYAIWAPAETISGNPVYLQNWNGCSALTATTYDSTTGSLAVSKNSIVALTDQRDNEIYTIAKLADGNCWMVDNLRLSTAGTTGNNINNPSVTNQSLSEGYGDSFIGLANPETSNFSNSTTSNSLYSTTIITGSNQGYRFPRYNEQNKTWNNNAASAITPTQIQTVASVNAHTDFNNYVYSYGNYYTWAAAIANISDYTTSNSHTDVRTSICPTGWHLPYGNTGNSGTNLGNTDGGYYNLANKMSATGDNRISSNKFRMFPNNFIYSGYTKGYRGGSGYYWSASASSANYAYRLYVGSTSTTPGNSTLYKYYGSSVRCVTESPYYTTTVNIEGDGIIGATISDGTSTQTISNSGDTVSLKAGTPYQVTVDKPVNYEASWATSDNGILSSVTTNSATYQVSGDTTLTITGTIAPSYEVAVSFDEHVNGVSLYHPDLGTQNITTSGDVVNLYRGVDYIIVASFVDNYTIDIWSTTTGGVISSPTSLVTTYVVTSPTSLSVASKAPDTITSFTPTACSSLSVGDIVELTDARDDSVYRVGKLADNNCWMLDNLRLDLTDSTVQSKLSSTTTNATNDVLSYLKGAKTGTTSDRYPTSPVESSMASSYSVPRINTAYKDTVASVTYGNSSGKIGIYYNYCAASAGSYCYGSGTNTTGTPSSDPNTSTLMDVTEDICPAGWRMPTSGTNGEYQTLYNAYSTASEGQVLGFKNALSTPLSGYFDNNSISSQGTYGNFWSSTYYGSSYMYRLYETTTAVTPSSYGYRYQGYPVRCILGAPSFSNVTVNLDANTDSITFTNPTYGTITVTPDNNTVELRQGVEYTITANIPSVAYDFASWSTSGDVTIGSTITNPTAFTINGDSTLSVSTAEKPSYEVTVIIDEHVRSVAFYQDTLGVQQVTTSGNTVSLRRGVEYIMTATFEEDYSTGTWTTTENGTIGSTILPATTYTVTGPATLSLTSTAKTGATTLLPGQELNTKMKTLAEGKSTGYNTDSSKIKALKMATFLPSDFTPSTANTVSVANSEKPVYIFFDDTDNAGIMYFYTEAKDIYMNANSSYAFYRNTALTNIDALANWNTSGVTNMSYMFSYASFLTNIDGASNWDTSRVTDMSYMFYGAFALTNIDGASNWDTSNVTNMSYMFQFASALTNIDGASNWNTSNVTNMSNMFYCASSLTNIDGASNWDNGSVTNMSYMFQATALTNIDGASNWDTGSVTDMSYMFHGSSFLTNIDGARNWDTGSVTDMSYMFYATPLTNIDGASNWDTSNVTNMSFMFYGTYALTNIDGARNWDNGNVTNMSFMFYDASALTNIDGASNWNTSNVTDMSRMFYGASALTNIDGASSWDTSSVTDMSWMFYQASALTNIDGASNWNTSNVTDMSYMFSSASALTNIDGASNWNTSNVTNMSYMFSSASALTNIDGARNWDIDKVANFSYMFSGAPSHVNFNIRSGTWNTSGTFTPVSIADSAAITINPDPHVMSITFFNATHGSRTIVSGETISLAKNTEYAITAVYESGYTLDSWTSTSGTIGSATSLSTTYQVASDDTLSITSTPASTSTVTLDIDSNVSSVSFSNPYYDVVTLTDDNDSTTLVNDLDYSIIIKYNDGYTGSISTSSNGTIGSTTIKGITYTVNGSDTLTITTTEKTGTATLDTGQRLNTAMKTLAEGRGTNYGTSSSKIKSLQMASFLPSDFTPSSANTISTSNSTYPVYIFFDNTDNAGIMYFYTDAKDIYMNVDSSFAFYRHIVLTDISAPSSWSTSNVTNMSFMFSGTSALTNIDGARNWNTSNVTDMSYMFQSAHALTNIDGASNWDTGSVTDMNSMFVSARALTNIDGASNWDTGSVTDMSTMFSDARALTNIDGARNWDTSNVTNMLYMFNDTHALTNIDGASNWDTSNVANMRYMFNGTYALTNIDGARNWDNGSVTDMSFMFSGSSSITNIDGASNWDTSNVTNMRDMFSGATILTNIDGASNWDTGSVTDMTSMFSGASALTNIDGARNWNTSNVTDMSYMFRYAYALTNIDGASNWDTSKVTNMSNMFYYARSLTNIDGARNWDTGSVTDMSYMFSNASSLTNIDGASNWDTSNVTDMRYMFFYATSLTNTSGANNWDVRAVTNYNFYNMFCDAGNSSTSEYHPEFTKRQGTWDKWGTFIPGDTTVPATDAVYVTVNFDEHVRSVGFYNSTYGTQQVTTSGSTVRVAKNTAYTISSSYEDGYTINSWSTTEGGTLASTNTPATSYTVTGATTLTLTSKQAKTGATTLLPGEELNAKLKSLAEGTTTTYDASSSKIKALRMADSLPADFTPSVENTVSVAGSEKPIYIFFDNTDDAGIMYFYSDAGEIYMNADSSHAFSGNTALTDLSALSSWNTTDVTNMSSMFQSASALNNIDALAHWDTGSVTDMSLMFSQASALTNIDGASSWNTGNVTNMSQMFILATSLADITGASNWNTASVTNMGQMFRLSSALTDLNALSGWNTSNVTSMRQMFESTSHLTNTSGANGWDVRNVRATAGSSTSSDNGFYNMFRLAGAASTGASYPTFTTRSGTWNSDGTFIPDDTTPPSSTPTSVTQNSTLATNPTSTNNSASATQPTTATNPDATNSPDSTTTSPHGVTTELSGDEEARASAAKTALAIAAVTSAISGVTFFTIAKRKKDEDEDEESHQP